MRSREKVDVRCPLAAVAIATTLGLSTVVILHEFGIAVQVFSVIGGYAFGAWLYDKIAAIVGVTDGND